MVALAPRMVQNLPDCLTAANSGLAASLNDTGTDEELLTAEQRIAHTRSVVF